MADKGLENLDKELEAVLPQKAVQKREAKKTAPKRKGKVAKAKQKVLQSKARRKNAVARASLKSGNGRIRINGRNIDLLKPKEIRELIMEPVHLSDSAAEIVKESDIQISVHGGGVNGQAQAARTALAKALALSNEGLRKVYLDYDRSLIVDDYRKVEPKKFRGPKARARFQKSYR
ncbi:MAG: 30S ribosomal protein S9 [Candidatus Micrarchaeota archaeon]|nr:30S ribosomal protein S9 [Candidatus Micrarchaeota archaeon]